MPEAMSGRHVGGPFRAIKLPPFSVADGTETRRDASRRRRNSPPETLRAAGFCKKSAFLHRFFKKTQNLSR